MTEIELAPGHHVGRYRIAGELGAGGMGRVYLAEDAELGRKVALKVLQRSGFADDAAERRFRSEVLTLAQLNHPHIVTVFDAGTLGDLPFVAMERIEGESLRQRLAFGPLPAAEAVAVVRQVARALTAAHAAGIVHRDVKPENVMVRPDGFVKVLDFGLAKALAPRTPEQGEQLSLRSGQQRFLGTPAYMSPEQMRAQPADARSDIWSLGVTLYELLTGRRPFGGPTMGDVIAAVLTAEPPPLPALGLPPELAAELEAILGRALAREREARYPTVETFERQLGALALALELAASPRHGLPTPSPSRSGAGAGPPAAAESSAEMTLALAGGPGLDAGFAPLPTPQTPFVERTAELDRLLGLLAEDGARLITLTGPGGTGKTRLAIEAARRLGTASGLTVCFVGLEAVTDPALVMPAVAKALGLEGAGGDSSPALLREHLRHRRLLLLLDNFEQVVAAAPAVGALLAAAPGLRVLATAREPLRLSGERELSVPPMALPEGDDLPPAAELVRTPAVALFVQRTAATVPGFALDEANKGLVVTICRLLDGLPLALELAAARVRLLDLISLRDRLQQGLGLLSGGPRDAPPRHQTMTATIAWSHALLTAPEQRLFRRLAVCRGGFGLAAADKVAPGAPGEDQVLLLASLVEKSFLRRVPGAAGEARFAMLQTLQTFALERLDEAGEHEACAGRHAAFFGALAALASGQLERAARGEVLAWMELEHDNFRAALGGSLATGERERALALAGHLWWFWYLRGHYEEARRALAMALLGADAAPAALRVEPTLGAGVFAFLQCDYDKAQELLREALALAEACRAERATALARQFLGSVARERGDYAAAIAQQEEARAAFAAGGDDNGAWRSRTLVALATWLAGDLAGAKLLAAETQDFYDPLGDCEGSCWARLNLAATALYGGDPQAAADLARAARRIAAEGGFREGLAWSLDLAGAAELAIGALDLANQHLRASLELHARLGDRWRMASVLERLASARARRGEAADAGRLLGAAEALRRRAGMPVPLVERPAVEELAHDLARTLGDRLLAAARAEGADLSRAELLALALAT